jgi:hypothetical protein
MKLLARLLRVEGRPGRVTAAQAAITHTTAREYWARELARALR